MVLPFAQNKGGCFIIPLCILHKAWKPSFASRFKERGRVLGKNFLFFAFFVWSGQKILQTRFRFRFYGLPILQTYFEFRFYDLTPKIKKDCVKYTQSSSR